MGLVVDDDEIDAFVERVARERFKSQGKDDSAKRRTIHKSVFFDRFNPRSQMKLLESDAKREGSFTDDFDRTWDEDGLERIASPESAVLGPLVVDDQVDAFVEGVARERFKGPGTDYAKGRGKDDSAKRRTIPESAFFDLFNPRSQLKFFEFGAFEEGQLADVFD